MRSVENQCWRRRDLLKSEEKFKFLLHSEAGAKWLAGTDRAMSDLVENVTKSRGFFQDQTFHTPATIAVQCLGNDRWKFVDNVPG